MCGRFALGLVYGFSTRFGVPEDPDVRPRYNIAPFQHTPVIVGGEGNELRWMRWGLVPHWARGEEFGLKLINVRSESALSKPMFKTILNRQRCLVPATGFYEWQRQGERKHPFHVRLKDEEYFAMAGIFDTWEGEGKELVTFSILTTEANEAVSQVHGRMPVILHRSQEGEWASREVLSQDSLREMFLPYPSDKMELYPVSDLVNDPRTDDPSMIVPRKVHQTTLF